MSASDRLTLEGPIKMTVTIGGQEICSKEDWDKVVLRQAEIMRENSALKQMLDAHAMASHPPGYAELEHENERLRGALKEIMKFEYMENADSDTGAYQTKDLEDAFRRCADALSNANKHPVLTLDGQQLQYGRSVAIPLKGHDESNGIYKVSYEESTQNTLPTDEEYCSRMRDLYAEINPSKTPE